METIKLNGTEKQVAWAEKIRKENLIYFRMAEKVLKETKEYIEKQENINQEAHDIVCESIEKLEAMKNQESAAWWIENGKMGHDIEMKDKPLQKLISAVRFRDINVKLRAIIAAVK